MRGINKLFVHHTATPDDMDIGVEEIRDWHTSPSPNDPSKPWSDIGYHIVIRIDGTVEQGRPMETPGAHAKGHNHDSIGIALVGTGPNFTKYQLSSLRNELDKLLSKHEAKVLGHRDVGDTECPGFNVRRFWYGES